MDRESIYSQSDRDQDRVLLQLEHPDWSEARIDQALKKRQLKTTCGIGIDPDTLPAEEPELIERPLPGRDKILAGAEREDPRILAFLQGELTIEQLTEALQIGRSQAYRRVQRAKERLRDLIVP